jgi:hypothetical protein
MFYPAARSLEAQISRPTNEGDPAALIFSLKHNVAILPLLRRILIEDRQASIREIGGPGETMDQKTPFDLRDLQLPRQEGLREFTNEAVGFVFSDSVSGTASGGCPGYWQESL